MPLNGTANMTDLSAVAANSAARVLKAITMSSVWQGVSSAADYDTQGVFPPLSADVPPRSRTPFTA